MERARGVVEAEAQLVEGRAEARRQAGEVPHEGEVIVGMTGRLEHADLELSDLEFVPFARSFGIRHLAICVRPVQHARTGQCLQHGSA